MILKFKYLKNSVPFIIGLSLGLYFITLNIIAPSLKYFPGDLGDGRFNNYILEHGHKFITGQIDDFWDAPFMYPEKKVITFSDNLLGTAPFYSIFRISGIDRETSFQLWFILMTLFSFISSYLFLNWCFKNRYAAVLGAMVFAFSMALQSQITHAQTFTRFPIPLAFWMALLFFKELKPIYFFFTIFFVVYQFYCAIYLGFMLSIPIGIMLLVILFYKKEEFKLKIKNIRYSGKLVSYIIINIVIILPLILPYVQRANITGMSNLGYVIKTVPTIKSFFFSQDGSLLWNFLNDTGIHYEAWWDHQIFPGGIAMLSAFLCILIVILKLINNRYLQNIEINSNLTIIIITGIITFILFLRFGGNTLYRIIYFLPGFGSLRSITRIINIELLFFAFVTSFVFSILLKKKTILTFLVFLFFTGLLIIDNYYIKGTSYRTEKSISQKRINDLCNKMKNIPDGSIVSYEPDSIETFEFVYQIDAMLASQSLNLKTINGYSGNSPNGYDSFWRNMNEESRLKWLDIAGFSGDSIYIIK